MENEKIFVVVPVYKVEPYLRRCIDSILNQTLADFRLILVDDGSPDNCPAICDEYAAKDSRIHVIHQENGGISAARNSGIDYAFAHGDPETDWINFIDSDDFVHPLYLEYLYKAVKESGAEISSCGNVVSSKAAFDSAPIASFKYESLAPEVYWVRKFTDATVAWGKLYRVCLFEKIRYPIGKLYEDNFTTYKLLFQHNYIAVVWTPLYCWYTNLDSITRSPWSPQKLVVTDALEEQLLFFKKYGIALAPQSTTRELFWHSIKHVMYVKHLSPKYDYLLRDVRTRRRRAFRLYAGNVGFRKAVSYWYEVQIKSPLKHVLRKESVFSFLKRKIKKKLCIRTK